MIPYSDDNPRHNGTFPFVTISLIGVCIAVFIYQFSLGDKQVLLFLHQYGFIPGRLTGAVEVPSIMEQIPAASTIVSSLFLHGGIAHLLGNMLFLWVFGDNIEAALGHARFLSFYLLCGVAACLLHLATGPNSAIPAVGASGAISGIMGAYLVLYPKAGINVLFIFGIFWRKVRMSAIALLGLWFALQFFGGFATLSQSSETGGVAFWAHVGGFIAGAVTIYFLTSNEQRQQLRDHLKRHKEGTASKQAPAKPIETSWRNSIPLAALKSEYQKLEKAKNIQKTPLPKSQSTPHPKGDISHSPTNLGPWGERAKTQEHEPTSIKEKITSEPQVGPSPQLRQNKKRTFSFGSSPKVKDYTKRNNRP